MNRDALTVCGVDGAPGGWAVIRAVVRLSDDSPPARTFDELDASFVAQLDDLVAEVRSGSIAALAIDMPIGLVDHQPRQADVEARALLGPRKSSVFPTPVRATLEATDYEDACDRSRAVSGKALSKQAFNLMPKIRQLDQLIHPDDQDRVVEAHPELAFVRLGGTHLAEPKRTADGQQLRVSLLRAMLRRPDLEAVLDSGVAPRLDLIDALANLSTAAHVAAGDERRLGIEHDSTRKRAEIVW